MSHVTHMNEPWVMSHIWMSHESCHTCEWDSSHVTHVTETQSCHAYEWDMSHVTHKRAMQHIYKPMSHVTRIWYTPEPPPQRRAPRTSFALDAYESVTNSYEFVRLVWFIWIRCIWIGQVARTHTNSSRTIWTCNTWTSSSETSRTNFIWIRCIWARDSFIWVRATCLIMMMIPVITFKKVV